MGVPEEGRSERVSGAGTLPPGTWHHPSPAAASSRTSARPGQTGRQPGPGTARGHRGHRMGNLPGRLALLGALLLTGEPDHGVLGMGLSCCWGFLSSLSGISEGGDAGSKLGISIPGAAFWVLPGRILSLSMPCTSVLAVPPGAVSLAGPCVCVSVRSVAVSVSLCVRLCTQ